VTLNPSHDLLRKRVHPIAEEDVEHLLNVGTSSSLPYRKFQAYLGRAHGANPGKLGVGPDRESTILDVDLCRSISDNQGGVKHSTNGRENSNVVGTSIPANESKKSKSSGFFVQHENPLEELKAPVVSRKVTTAT